MDSIGDKLREARARQGADLADIEAKTKIRTRYLRALENEEFDLLPGHAYARSFLRTYAELLGLDAHTLVQTYRQRVEGEGPTPQVSPEAETSQTPPPPEEQDQGEAEPRHVPRRVPAPPSGRRRFRKPAVVAVAACIAIGVVLILVGLLSGSGSQHAQVSKAVAPPPPAPPPPAAAPKPPPVPAQVSLTVIPTERTYICVDAGPSREIFQGIISDPRTFNGQLLRITLGKRTAQLQANGRPIPVTAEPVGFQFTPTQLLPLGPQQRPCPAPATSSSSSQGNSGSGGTSSTGTEGP
jgi:cytoskeleton protein RodZ